MINIIIVLTIVSLISLLGLRVVYNNEVHRALKIEKGDLYKNNMEAIITEINVYSLKNKLIIDDIKKDGVRQNILDKTATLLYKKDTDIFEVIYNKGIRYEFNIRYKVVEGSIYFLPEKTI